MYVNSMSVFLNRWFRSYEEARDARAVEGGYLFPYEHHFFVADGEAVLELGIDPADPDWERIGWDWVRPLDLDAWQRLKRKRELSR
jgi:hypothetical protein